MIKTNKTILGEILENKCEEVIFLLFRNNNIKSF